MGVGDGYGWGELFQRVCKRGNRIKLLAEICF